MTVTNQDLSEAILRLEEKVDTLSKTLDELTGAKKFLMWITGIAVGISAFVATWWQMHGPHK